MKKIMRELEKLANDIRSEHEEMAREVREGGRQSKEGFERVMSAVHKLHSVVSAVPNKLDRLRDHLKTMSSDGNGHK